MIGSEHLAGGFVVPALLGSISASPKAKLPGLWRASSAGRKRLPCGFRNREYLAHARLIEDMDSLEKQFGYVVSDFNTDGVLNTALHLRGQQFFLDLQEDPELVSHLCTVIMQTQCWWPNMCGCGAAGVQSA